LIPHPPFHFATLRIGIKLNNEVLAGRRKVEPHGTTFFRANGLIEESYVFVATR
jgi:hypothetical protein